MCNVPLLWGGRATRLKISHLSLRISVSQGMHWWIQDPTGSSVKLHDGYAGLFRALPATVHHIWPEYLKNTIRITSLPCFFCFPLIPKQGWCELALGCLGLLHFCATAGLSTIPRRGVHLGPHLCACSCPISECLSILFPLPELLTTAYFSFRISP